MTADRIVEVYSAGNIVEAQSLAEVLEEAGVAAQVVGDMLGNAAGWLPQTETAPRVWVREADEARAREIIAVWLRDPRAIVAEGAAGESADMAEPPETDSRKPDDADQEEPVKSDEIEEPASSAVGQFSLVNRAIAIAGVASFCAGAYFAMQGWFVQRRFSQETEAYYVGYKMGGYEIYPVASVRDLPIRQSPTRLRTRYNIFYAYEADGKECYAELQDCPRPPEVVIVHYDPDQPMSNVVGPLTPPWVSLLLGAAVGGLLIFVSWRFR